ncbi:hypothetical protein LWI29_011010 [Acer saccharum]|uniref:PORR domain-containing protein n=1 Tax=Acer saccharum TaxID=4024 RepID=A0AA39V0F2_ACESA|nr:hypothetical protein LWI29_011010 [Acer saccharum]
MQLFFRRRYCHHSFSDATTKWSETAVSTTRWRGEEPETPYQHQEPHQIRTVQVPPITIIAQQKDSLKIPIRPIDFVRKYPSVFQEFLPETLVSTLTSSSLRRSSISTPRSSCFGCGKEGGRQGENRVSNEIFNWFSNVRDEEVMDDWQKLPYISPYEDSSHLLSKSDESDKWAVAILHEVLSLFGSKKRRGTMCLSRRVFGHTFEVFKRVLLNYPGIFYVSTKIGTYTAVLRDGYKRGSLIGSDPLMNIRSQYIHLMNTVKEDRKVVAVQSGGEEEKDVESLDVSDNEEEDVSDDDFEDDDEEEEEDDMHRRGAHKNAAISRGRTDRNVELEKKGNSRNHERGNSRGIHENAKEEVPAKYPRRRKGG